MTEQEQILQTRLNKAIQIFNEQKTEIEKLTQERDNYKIKLDETLKINAKLNDIVNNVKDEIESRETKLNYMTSRIVALEQENKELQNQVNWLDEDIDDQQIQIKEQANIIDNLIQVDTHPANTFAPVNTSFRI